MTETKTELLAWLNDLLQIKYTRVEQLGNGAAYCQIMDSVYGDIPMPKVKFASKNEYDHINNFKILQHCFTIHGVDRNIPVDKLIKCRFNDNLEFLQWIKKYWDAYYPGGGYDATARRTARQREVSGSPNSPAAQPASPLQNNYVSCPGVGGASVDATNNNHTASGSRPQSPDATARMSARSPISAGARKLSGEPNSMMMPSAEQEKVIRELTRQLMDLRFVADTLERERNFYYLKLRDLEVLVVERMEKAKNSNRISEEVPQLLNEVLAILYSTEEGFISPRAGKFPSTVMTNLAPTSSTPLATSAVASAAPSRPLTASSKGAGVTSESLACPPGQQQQNVGAYTSPRQTTTVMSSAVVESRVSVQKVGGESPRESQIRPPSKMMEHQASVANTHVSVELSSVAGTQVEEVVPVARSVASSRPRSAAGSEKSSVKFAPTSSSLEVQNEPSVPGTPVKTPSAAAIQTTASVSSRPGSASSSVNAARRCENTHAAPPAVAPIITSRPSSAPTSHRSTVAGQLQGAESITQQQQRQQPQPSPQQQANERQVAASVPASRRESNVSRRSAGYMSPTAASRSRSVSATALEVIPSGAAAVVGGGGMPTSSPHTRQSSNRASMQGSPSSPLALNTQTSFHSQPPQQQQQEQQQQQAEETSTSKPSSRPSSPRVRTPTNGRETASARPSAVVQGAGTSGGVIGVLSSSSLRQSKAGVVSKASQTDLTTAVAAVSGVPTTRPSSARKDREQQQESKVQLSDPSVQDDMMSALLPPLPSSSS